MSLDKTIVKFSGAKNYMDQLAQITGHMTDINEEFYNKQINMVKSTYNSIMNKLENYKTREVQTFIKNTKEHYTSLNLNELYHDVLNVRSKKSKNPPKLQHKVRITPKDIYNSAWFKDMLELEKNAADIVGEFEITSNKMNETHKKLVDTNPGVIESFKFYGIRVNDDETTGLVFATSKFINKIIEIILTPMYDVRAKMDKNWLPRINDVLGVELKNKLGNKAKDIPITEEDIKDYVYKFLLTKYRLDVTGNVGDFTKTLMSTLDSSVVSDANPARFINLMDNLKIDEIENSKGVKKIVELARSELVKISENKDMKPAELLSDINKILNYEESDSEEEKKDQEEEDIF